MDRPKSLAGSLSKLASAVLVLAVISGYQLMLSATAAQLLSRSLQIQNSTPGANTVYVASFTINSSSSVGSLQILLCSNTPLESDSCTPPSGLNMTGAVLTAQSGLNDFSLLSATANSLILSRTPGAVTPPLPISLTFSNIVNPSSAGSYYARISTYSSIDGSGSSIDFGGIAFAIVNGLQISSAVPPYLDFCSGVIISGNDCSTASGDYLNFGGLSSSQTRATSSQLLVATNASSGYTVQVFGTTMTSGNNIINAMDSNDISRPGVAQFGINLRGNQLPPIGADPSGSGSGTPTTNYNVPNSYLFVSNDSIINSPTADSSRKYTVSYIVNVPLSQPAGVYDSTMTYVCSGNF